MNTLTALAGTLGLSVGWCIGHSTARIRHVPIGATHEQDEAALSLLDPDEQPLDDEDEQLIAAWRAQLDALSAPQNPEDPTT
jgi:hypothetical protein